MGKTGRIASISGLLLIGTVGTCGYLARCHAPFVADSARGEITEGINALEVSRALARHEIGRFPLVSCQLDPASPDRRSNGEPCFEAISTRAAAGEDASMTLEVLYMGPAYVHNDFEVRFGSSGTVESTADLRSWD